MREAGRGARARAHKCIMRLDLRARGESVWSYADCGGVDAGGVSLFAFSGGLSFLKLYSEVVAGAGYTYYDENWRFFFAGREGKMNV